MIGLFLPYRGESLSPPAIQSFANALRRPLAAAPPVNKAGESVMVGHSQALTPSGERVLFSGYLLHRRALRLELGIDEGDDAQLYAAAYARWGDAADLRVQGDYATIIVSPDAPRVRLVASPIYCQPLHYSRDADRLIVASRSQAIFDTGVVERVVNEQKIADSLYLNYSDSAQDWFVGLKRLPGGHRAWLEPGSERVERFYDVRHAPDVRFKRDEDYVEAADHLFAEGVRAMLDGFSRPAISLSGGYDSQAVAAYVMRERPGKRLLGLTSVPEEGWDGIARDGRFGDERQHVLAFAAMYPELETRWVDAAGRGFEHFDREFFQMSSLAGRNAMNLHWIHDVTREAARDGCDILLTGAVGNMSFSYNCDGLFASLLAQGRLLALLQELWWDGPLSTMPRRFVGQAVMRLAPESVWRKVGVWRRGRAADPFETWCPLSRDYAREMRVDERAAAFGHDPFFQPGYKSREVRANAMAALAGDGADMMLAFEVMHGVASRDPTAYRPLLEFCMGIPDEQYLKRGQRRWLAKRMLRGMVPDMVLDETRRGLQSADWHLRLKRQRDALIEEIDWLKEDPTMARRLNLDSIRQALVDFPDKTPQDKLGFERLCVAIPRALHTARYIRYMEGRNR